MVGYENFPAAPITTSFDGAINQLDKDLERRIKEYLAIRCGMQEIFTYPWMDESYVNAILQDTASTLSGVAALAVAVVLAYRNQSLIVVALASSGAAFLAERLLGLPF